MKTVPISGTMRSVSFEDDDTIDLVRQLVALEMNSHPDRMFLEVKGRFPKDYYSSNPKRWTDLFFRLSFDGKTIALDSMQTYITQTRPGLVMTPQAVTQEQWEDHEEFLKPMFDPEEDFEEWRILGVERSVVVPLPPRDVPVMPANIPIPQLQSLFDTFHSYEITELRATIVSEDASELVKRNYYPRLRPDTPPNIETLRSSILGTQAQFQKLMRLDAPAAEKVSVVRAKWYIPWVSTRFPSPRTRFEQIFYGMTLSENTTPYIGYFTAKTETIRHKFYVKNPKDKKIPEDFKGWWKGWIASTMPQRRTPTLLLYRGSSRASFDRVAITSKDITVDVHREKTSTQTLDELKSEILTWIMSLDALVPFMVASDMDVKRWELGDLSLLGSYAKEVQEFDMLRFPCLQSIFSFQKDTFRLLRAEHGADEIPPRELQANQLLTQEDAEQTPEYLAREMDISIAEATEIFTSLRNRAEEFDIEKSLKAYPIVKFSNKDVIVRFMTNPERTLRYADILRFVLTSESESVNEVCPRRMEVVGPKVAIPQQEITEEDAFAPVDMDFGFEDEDEEATEEGPQEAKIKKLRVVERKGTYNYFNNRLQKFDPNTFDKSIYPGKCDKPKQVIALTEADKTRIGDEYNYKNAPEEEVLKLQEPDASIICPPYWCMRDEIPLREEQLKLEDGELHCPVCNGKVRANDSADPLEFTVIKRDVFAKYPDYLRQVSSINGRKIPCCYQQPRSNVEVLETKEEVMYVRDASNVQLPAFRMGYLSEELAQQLKVSINYGQTVKKGRLVTGESDVFRVGIGRPSKTLPTLLNDKTPIPRPRDGNEQLMKCSFVRTWNTTHEGDTTIERIIAAVDDAYQDGTLPFLDELEYVTAFLQCEVILINSVDGKVICGFWTGLAPGKGATIKNRKIAVIDNNILTKVTRNKGKAAGSRLQYSPNLLEKPFDKETFPHVRELHTRACSTDMPTLTDAINELESPKYSVILDPYERIQAVFVPTKFVLPIFPIVGKPDPGVDRVYRGYVDVDKNDLPTASDLRTFLSNTKHPKFKITRELANTSGQIVEFLLTSGLRAPVKPEGIGHTPAEEVTQAIRTKNEDMLISDISNEKDARTAEEVSFSEEFFQFLMYSLSKDIQEEQHGDLREFIETKSENLYKELKKWADDNTYSDASKSPVEFINKVRTPCGQFTQKDACNKSSLCGWHKNTCKIRVKPIVDKQRVLNRMVKVLRENDKQRALVLDDRISPFFSTILYLEMPNELITTSVS